MSEMDDKTREAGERLAAEIRENNRPLIPLWLSGPTTARTAEGEGEMNENDRAMAREYRRSAQVCRATLSECSPLVAMFRRVRAWAYDKLADRIERDPSKG